MTDERKAELRENYRVILENLRGAERYRPEGCGGVRVLAATKRVCAEEVAFAVRELGITAVGENRSDELLEKLGDPIEPYRGAELHFIGTLQSRKARLLAGRVDMVQSVDGVALAEELNRRSAERGVVTDVLVEINIGREPNKSGVRPEDFDAVAGEIETMGSLRLRGGMTMGPKCENFNEYRKFFKETYNIVLDFFRKKSHNIGDGNIIGDNLSGTPFFPLVSMGMSDSYAAAAAEGAGMVRIGSALFGERK